MNIQPQFISGAYGKPLFVVITVAEFQRMLDDAEEFKDIKSSRCYCRLKKAAKEIKLYKAGKFS